MQSREHLIWVYIGIIAGAVLLGFLWNIQYPDSTIFGPTVSQDRKSASNGGIAELGTSRKSPPAKVASQPTDTATESIASDSSQEGPFLIVVPHEQIAQHFELPPVGKDAPSGGLPVGIIEPLTSTPSDEAIERPDQADTKSADSPGGTLPDQPENAPPESLTDKAAITSEHSEQGLQNEPSELEAQKQSSEQLPERPRETPADHPQVTTRPEEQHYWPWPRALLEQLTKFSEMALSHGFAVGAQWAEQSCEHIRQLWQALDEGNLADALTVADLVANHAAQATRLAKAAPDEVTLVRLRSVADGLARRVRIWKALLEYKLEGLENSTAVGQQTANAATLLTAIAAVQKRLGTSPKADRWRDYLLLGQLESAAIGHSGEDRLLELSQSVLVRLAHAEGAPERRRLLSEPVFRNLKQELAALACPAIDDRHLLELLEHLETDHSATAASTLAQHGYVLQNHPNPLFVAVGDAVLSGYRRANFRVAISEEFVNRLVPAQAPQYRPVYDVVGGRPIVGKSICYTDVYFRMLPDPNNVVVQLQVKGKIRSSTSTIAGPAVFFDDGEAIYEARKTIRLKGWQVMLSPSVVRVFNRFQLRDVRTDFDPFPLLGDFARDYARLMHEENADEASQELRQKLAWQVQQQVDQEAQQRFARLNARLKTKLLDPMARMNLGPVLVSARTTDQRAIMEMLLAGGDQLGAHTARVWAPANSLASCQLHESVLNNALEQLDLAGKTISLAELEEKIASLLGVDQPQIDPKDREVIITFPEEPPLQVRFGTGLLQVSIKIARLARPPHFWYNFEVRAFYRPETDGLAACLRRDGVIHLIGNNLRLRDQIALRGVFSRTFSKNRPWPLVPQWLVEHPAFRDLVVTQLLIEDGWIGLAIGPKSPVHVAEMTRSEATK